MDWHITYKLAKKEIAVGDKVYIVDDGMVRETTVQGVRRNHLRTQDGILYFCDHREKWFREEIFARLAAKGE